MSGKPRADFDEIEEERRRLRYLRTLVDLTASVIMQTRPETAEAERVVEEMRRHILAMFPGKEGTYDLIYRPRFERLIREYAKQGGRSAGIYP